MIRLFARTSSKEYPVFLGSGILKDIGGLWGSLERPGKIVIITDSNVAGLYLKKVEQSFAEAGFATSSLVVQAGEEAKSLSSASELFSSMFHQKTRRRDTVCALGGGVVGDLAGFVASTYMRGVSLIQAPTTLLSQVDSSIGGKVGINIPEAKNYVGSFYQPDMVVTDPMLLKTLPREQVVDGLAEVIKYALLSGEEFLESLESDYERILGLDMGLVESMVHRCIEYKIKVVLEDERDFGKRAVLNLGHTVGHGIEAAGRYEAYSHGEAVALGLIAAMWLSEMVLSLSSDYSVRLTALLDRAGLPTRLKGIDPEEVLAVMASDKKADDISANMVLLKDIGSPLINCDVEAGMLRRAVEGLAEGG